MILETKFSTGDRVFVATLAPRSPLYHIEGPFQVGQVRKVITDSPGVYEDEGDTYIVFDNYKAQKKDVEEYMFVETGIGTGTVWKPENMFLNAEDALARADELNREASAKKKGA